MAAIRGSALPITVTVEGVDLTGATVTMVFGWHPGKAPVASKTKTSTAGDITIAYDAGTEASTLTLTLADTETADCTQNLYYAIYVGDGTPGGDWVPDNGGTGMIQFTNSVLKS